MIIEALIYVASTCAAPGVEECSVIPHPLNPNSVLLEVCNSDLNEPREMTFVTQTGVPKVTIDTVHKPMWACSSNARPKDHLHWMQVPRHGSD